MNIDVPIEEWLARIEAKVDALVERQQLREWYEVSEFAALVRKADYTVREWVRLGRLRQKAAKWQGKA